MPTNYKLNTNLIADGMALIPHNLELLNENYDFFARKNGVNSLCDTKQVELHRHFRGETSIHLGEGFMRHKDVQWVLYHPHDKIKFPIGKNVEIRTKNS